MVHSAGLDALAHTVPAIVVEVTHDLLRFHWWMLWVPIQPPGTGTGLGGHDIMIAVGSCRSPSASSKHSFLAENVISAPMVMLATRHTL